MTKRLNLVGVQFGDLTVKAMTDPSSWARQGAEWVCVCKCGNMKIVRGGDLTSGKTRSCGCLRRRNPGRPPTHGRTKTTEFKTWDGMKQRCLNPRAREWKHYGGRGITIHPGWIHDFEAFYAYIGPKPSPEMSLDRIDNDGNYEPGNVRWATPKQQAASMRRPKRGPYKRKSAADGQADVSGRSEDAAAS